MKDSIDSLAKILSSGKPVTVLTGAGISLSSGLPVYRDNQGNWAHTKPVEGPAFRKDHLTRQRYWCRSYVGWPTFAAAQPNAAHREIAALEHDGPFSTVITQNVDNLHQLAGSRELVSLHGRLSEVICLQCADITPRQELQSRLQTNNPNFQTAQFKTAPDGDAQIDDQSIRQFNPVNCRKCNGILKPDVVFFGDNVPKPRVQYSMERVLESGALLCIGTSLMVFSGFRFCRVAKSEGIPIVIINTGVTRADDIATLKINHHCADVLTKLRHKLHGQKYPKQETHAPRTP